MAKRNRFGLKQDERGIWRCDFSVAGVRVQRSSYTKVRASAEEWCAKVESDLWRQKKLGEQPTLLWQEAAALWFKSKEADRKRSISDDDDKRRVIAPHLDGTKLTEVSTWVVDGVLDKIMADRSAARGKPLANGTRNRYRSFIIGVLNFARKKGYTVAEANPEKRSEPKEKVVWITQDQARRLLAAINDSESATHLRRMVEFSLATGLRQSNVTGLRWSRVDLARRIAWVEPEDAKAGETIPVPLNDWAIGVLIEARNCEDHGHEKLCFTYFGRQVSEPANTAWHKACEKVDDLPEEWTWHCMRHTWASWHVMGLFSDDGTPTPLEVLQKLGGWSDIKMVMKYAHLAPNYTAKFAGNSGLRQPPADVVKIGATA